MKLCLRGPGSARAAARGCVPDLASVHPRSAPVGRCLAVLPEGCALSAPEAVLLSQVGAVFSVTQRKAVRCVPWEVRPDRSGKRSCSSRSRHNRRQNKNGGPYNADARQFRNAANLRAGPALCRAEISRQPEKQEQRKGKPCPRPADRPPVDDSACLRMIGILRKNVLSRRRHMRAMRPFLPPVLIRATLRA